MAVPDRSPGAPPGSAPAAVPPARPVAFSPPPDELSFFALVNPVLAHRSLVVRLGLLGLLVGALTGLLRARTYTATASFAPQGRRTPSSVSGLAAQFGVAVPGADATQTPQFYVDLMGTRTLLGKLAETPVRTATGSTPLWQRLELKNVANPSMRRDASVRALRRAVGAGSDPRTGLVSLRVTMKDSSLARFTAERLLELVNTFNLERRRVQASAERRFTEVRLEEASRDLRAAETRFEDFSLRNRDITGAPTLILASERLRRAVTLREQLYLTLVQAFEQARLDEVRDTPVITIIEEPAVPARPDARGTVMRGLLGGVVGAGLAILIALARQMGRPAAPGANPGAEFRAHVRALAADVRRPWRLLRAPRT